MAPKKLKYRGTPLGTREMEDHRIQQRAAVEIHKNLKFYP